MNEMTPKSLNPKEAWDLLQQDPRAILIDVRSSMEYLFVGHPKGAVHIPWIDEPEWVVNPNFVRSIRELTLGGVIDAVEGGSAPILLICRSGKRSLEAGRLLLESGFSDVSNIEEGFEGELDEEHHRSTTGGWRFHGLAWEQC
ncbi:MAG TPA: rhodanese-like domain-containing protein [Ectothiorhodospiraceae bacterium]|nr:rhodanese-like domain-containing protein [Ectothiorhodospiraceae bacterium]